MFTTFIPVESPDLTLNRYIVDFFNHGIVDDLEADNLLDSGDVYNKLHDFALALKVNINLITNEEVLGHYPV